MSIIPLRLAVNSFCSSASLPLFKSTAALTIFGERETVIEIDWICCWYIFWDSALLTWRHMYTEGREKESKDKNYYFLFRCWLLLAASLLEKDKHNTWTYQPLSDQGDLYQHLFHLDIAFSCLLDCSLQLCCTICTLLSRIVWLKGK